MIQKQYAGQVIQVNRVPETVSSEEKLLIRFLAISVHEGVIFTLTKSAWEIYGFFECFLICILSCIF